MHGGSEFRLRGLGIRKKGQRGPSINRNYSCEGKRPAVEITTQNRGVIGTKKLSEAVQGVLKGKGHS